MLTWKQHVLTIFQGCLGFPCAKVQQLQGPWQQGFQAHGCDR